MAKRTVRSEADDTATRTAPDRRRGGAEREREPGGNQQAAPTEALAPVTAREDRDTTLRSMSSEPSEEDIRLRAYHRYLERGGGHGMDFDDWVGAEQELKGSRR